VRATWGPITGIVHGAGIIADKPIAAKDPASFARVLSTKVDGLAVLLHATAGDPLKVLALFSSVAARCGNVGQVDYAAGNEVLNKVARAEAARRGPACRVVSLGWGPWEGGMVTPALKARFEKLGVPLIPIAGGAQLFVDALRADATEPEWVLGGAPRAEALLNDGPPPPVHLDLWVNARTQPALAGHAIDGQPVVPVVFAAEWMARAARAAHPEGALVAVEDVALLKGIVVPDFAGAGLRLRLVATPRASESAVDVALHSLDGRKHYTAVVRFAPAASAPAAAAPAPAGESWGARPVYGDVLFHTGPFAVLSAVERVSPAGLVAQVGGVLPGGWAPEPWVTDPAALDGALQGALLWMREATGGAHSLPTGIRRVVVGAPQPGPLELRISAQLDGAARARVDAALVDSAGRAVARLEGVSLHARPSRPVPAA